jgi:MFS family permease
MTRAKHRDLRAWLLIAFAFLSSFAASGSLPLIAKAVASFNSSWGFAPYFIAILLGQLTILFSRPIRESRFTIPVVIVGFTLSIFLLAEILRAPNASYFLVGIVSVRFLEGIMVGIGLPRIFETIVKSDFGRSADSRMVSLNLSNVAGFVLGVPFSEGWRFTDISFLQTSGVLLALLGLIYITAPSTLSALSFEVKQNRPEMDAESPRLQTTGWFSSFYLLFVAKCFYGYLISYLVYQAALMPVPMFWMTLILSAVFAIGQVASAFGARRFSIQSLEIYLPMIFAVVLVTLAVVWTFVPLIIGLFFHSTLYFFGLRKSATGFDSSRDFARVNSLSDPGIIFGSLLSIVGPGYALFGIAMLAVLPFFKSALGPIGEVRAERMHPLVGPITIWKMFRKQRNPVLNRPPNPGARWSLERPASGAVIRFLFAGDTVFSADQATFSAEDEAWIRNHNIRALNLEAPLASPPKGAFSSEFLCSSAEALDTFNGTNADPLFDTFSVVNNHSLDRGLNNYRASLAELERRGLLVVDEDSRVQTLDTSGGPFRIGWLAKSFGLNLPWLQSQIPGGFMNPDTMLGAEEVRKSFQKEIAELKSRCDLICFSYHWGYEAESQPDLMHLQAWEFFRECGIDLVFGHHPHIPHPVHFNQDFSKMCLSSAGNLNLNLNLGCEIYDVSALYSIDFEIVSRSFSKLETRFFRKQSVGGQLKFIRTELENIQTSQKISEQKYDSTF